MNIKSMRVMAATVGEPYHGKIEVDLDNGYHIGDGRVWFHVQAGINADIPVVIEVEADDPGIDSR
jgi:hypothetical protein